MANKKIYRKDINKSLENNEKTKKDLKSPFFFELLQNTMKKASIIHKAIPEWPKDLLKKKNKRFLNDSLLFE